MLRVYACTWYMHAYGICAGVHVLRVRPDASDLPRVLRWLAAHGDAAQACACNANAVYVSHLCTCTCHVYGDAAQALLCLLWCCHITMTHCGAARGGGGARARVRTDAPAARRRVPGALAAAIRRALSRATHGGAAPCRQARTTGVALRGSGAAVVREAQRRQGAGPACQMLPRYHS